MTDKIEEQVRNAARILFGANLSTVEEDMERIFVAASASVALRTRENEVVEECARVMDERAAMYRAKAERHDIAEPDSLNTHEGFISNAEGAEWGATDIRNLKSAQR